ncbi:hypothetical protein V2G26_010325 [Clonostachys chloroleuca]|uniref:Sterol 3-beta-glucosyltransferase UGT80B1 n=1 Tax=Clonostachys chloroleuca TaxID=1926264 RepID=A0AA35LQZ0_9HYPO|nr:unnamed protein product [Clonostachys chloroleuca]
MALNLTRTRSHGPGHIAFEDATAKKHPSGNVDGEGRVNVQFYDNPEALAAWARHFQHSLCEPERPRPRRQSSFAVPLDEDLTCNPRLNIAIHIVGSRGDVQPFIPIAQLLSRPPYNHRVRICTHPVFKDFVEEQGVEFFSIGGNPEALMAYMVKNPGLLPSRQSLKAGDVSQRRKEMWEIINGAWRSCIESGDGMGPRVTAARTRTTKDLFIADAIIANPPSMAHIHCAEKLGIPLHMVFTMPWSPTEKFSHPLAAMSYGDADRSMANYLSFMMVELLTWEGLGDLINKFRMKILHLDSISPMWGYQLLPRMRVPFSYLWSSSLIPKPDDWGSHITINGFSFLKLAHTYTPPPDLTAFLEKGPTPIYIGFGSIVVEDPQALTNLVFDAVKLAGVRAIVSKGWGGVGGKLDVPDDIYLIGNTPHDWLFNHVSAVVHHGGAGTTAAGIAAGRPTVVVPFFGDQPFWGQMMARAGAGPSPVPFNKMTAETLANSILFALEPQVLEAAQTMAEAVAQEDGAAQTAADFHDRLSPDDFRCDVCPERLAVWLHKPTGTHLSAFACCVLVHEGLIQPNHVRPLRHKHWYVDEGAENPIVGAAAAFSGFFTAVGTATKDYSQRLKTRPRASKATDSDGGDSHIGTSGSDTVNDDGDKTTDDTAVRTPSVWKERPPLTPVEMETIAFKLATKSLRSVGDTVTARLPRAPSTYERRLAAWKLQEQGRHGNVYYITRATGRYAADIGKAGLKAPVAFLYNVANGFHNVPSYSLVGPVDVRRRDEITGVKSGFKTAGTEFVLGIWDAFSGIVVRPYNGAKTEGAKGFGKGMYHGVKGVLSNLGAAFFGLPGYSLKGIEKALAKDQVTRLKAELLLIRLRQGIDDFHNSTMEERDKVTMRWESTYSRA